jgi:NitT/TauT family transport system permease protein
MKTGGAMPSDVRAGGARDSSCAVDSAADERPTEPERPAGAGGEGRGSAGGYWSSLSERRRMVILAAGLFLAFYGAWRALGSRDGIRGEVFPGFGEIGRSLWEMVRDGALWEHLQRTSYSVLVAFGISIVLGTLIGLAFAAHPLLRRIMAPLVAAGFGIPKVTLFPILLTIFGLGVESKIAGGVVHGIFPAIVNTMAATYRINPLHLEMSDVFGASRVARYRLVVMPTVRPYVVAGARVALSLTVLGVIVAEFVQSNAGIGYFVHIQFANSNYPGLYAALIATMVFVIAVDFALGLLERLSRAPSSLERRTSAAAQL